MQDQAAAAISVRHIRSHTGLRGLAAILVVAYHLQFGGGHHFAWEDFTPFFRSGYLWVDLFFVLSGFIISHAFRTAQRPHIRAADARAFWRARIARVLPLHLFCLGYLVAFWSLVTLARLAAGMATPEVWSPDSSLALLRQLLLLDAWGLGPQPGWNIPSWSIGAELFAYSLFPGVAILLQKRQGTTAGVLLVQAVAFYALVGTTTGSLDIIRGLAIWRCLAGFSLGVLIHWQRGRIATLPETVLAAAQAVALLLLVATLLGVLPDVWFAAGSAVLVAATWTDRGLLCAALSSKPLQWLGEISYSIYLNHVCLIAIAGYFWARSEPHLMLSPGLGRAAWILLVLLLTLGVSSLTCRHIEVPWRRRLLASGARQASTIATTAAPRAG